MDYLSKPKTSQWIVLVICVLFWFDSAWLRADWPEHRGNCQRTGYHEQPLKSKQWEPFWQLDDLSPPQPAWPAPATASLWQKLDHLEARVTDDKADVPLIVVDANGKSHVLIASSANDRLVSVDPMTGRIEWQYVTRAPVRYAPSVLRGVAYLGADDGIVRAIDIAGGDELWQTHIGPPMPWIVGNSRLVSPHSIRTSVLVQEERVYASAGLFPSQGVYMVALHSHSGELVWRRKISQSPQGYLLADEEKIIVPTGRTQPFAVDKKNGQFMFDLLSPGGSFCMLTPEAFFTGPGNSASVQANPIQAGTEMFSLQGRQVVVGGGKIWTANGARLVCHSMPGVAKKAPAPEWTVDCKLDQALVVTGQKNEWTVFVAGGSEIQTLDAATGGVLQYLSLGDENEEIKYLAMSRLPDHGQEVLIAATRSGKIFAWRGTRLGRSAAWPKKPAQSIQTTLASDSDQEKVTRLKQQLTSPRGLALLLKDNSGGMAESLLKRTEIRVVSLVRNSKDAKRLQREFQERGWYGHRISIWHCSDDEALPFSKGLFNVLVEAEPTSRPGEDLVSMVTPATGLVWRHGVERPELAPALSGVGVWRHQYADLSNRADSMDSIVGKASAFRLLWFGGVGPSRMPDRHLRGPAPLVASGTMVLQGDGVLIGVDPANGTERWQLRLPEKAIRYVTPLDAGYACLTRDGRKLFVAANDVIWQVNALSGKVEREFLALQRNMHWGYVAELNDHVYATLMKPTAARTARDLKTRLSYVALDYRSERPLVTSRHFVCMDQNGSEIWSYQSRGVILHGSIAMDPDQVVFVEARSADCANHTTDRIPMQPLMQDAHLICLSAKTGEVDWEKPLDLPDARNMLYVQMSDRKIIMTSSISKQDKATYVIRVLGIHDGSLIWETQHEHIRQGLFHGEQVHHPVILQRTDQSVMLIAEPYLYDLNSGKRMVPSGAATDWALSRPGHSCGTLSGAGDCLFFRASNPTVLNMSDGSFSALAPTRPGCWINMVPAGGKLLIPEGSASCICNYSLQTSMAFEPIGPNDVETALPVLTDVLPFPKSVPAKDV